MANIFVVCMDSSYIRDAQMFDTSGLTEEEFDEIDRYDENAEQHWHDIDPNPFIAVVRAVSEEEACERAGKETGYDPRCLYAFKAIPDC